MLPAELMTSCTAGTDTSNLTRFADCAASLVSRTQYYIWTKSGYGPRFKWQNSPSRAFAIRGKIDTTLTISSLFK